jgi:hypothetical protein
MSTALFDPEGRAGEIERIVKSGTCVTCRCIQGTWKRVSDNNTVKGRHGVVVGHWERNRLLGSDVAEQILQVRITSAQVWNSLVFHYRMHTSMQLTPVVELSAEQHHSILLEFFVSQVETGITNRQGNFTCSTCQRRVHVSKACRKDSCPATCPFKQMCFNCAWAYTAATKEDKGEVADRRLNLLGAINSNRDKSTTLAIGQVKFKCEGCQERGIYRRLDREVLDSASGFCAHLAREGATTETEETPANP